MAELLEILHRHWGYGAFRPRQEEIVRSLLAGRDACVVMPTGGGKSLCYQLPAAMEPDKTTIVVSPLISLMQDQVNQLRAAGIAAAVLNSSLDAAAAAAVRRGTLAGQYRLLYLSPERLARADTIGWLSQAPVARFVVDEAHCISEWGHEFRPEYRQLSRLREHFPGCSIAAFTASATRRVRHDILQQLQLRQPATFIASFHRPNLRYLVSACRGEAQQQRRLLRLLRHHAGESVIVYAATTARVEQTAAWLTRSGHPAIAYHGKMEAELRRRNQQAWMNDEVRVLVGTLAFGLGINKPGVRAIAHLALTKSIEQYYQEAGRAGRDGEPADCVLLWRKRDLGLLAHFIETVADPEERERAWQRYHQVKGFVSAPACRHRQICQHFGETARFANCGACDVCAPLPPWLLGRDGGGERAAKPRSAAAVRPSGRPRGGEDGLDPRLRAWRKEVATTLGWPAFCVLSNRTLEAITAARPRSLAALGAVAGIGPRRLEQFGAQILEVLSKDT